MLEFEIKNQTIKRIDRFNPATDSVDYLTAKFNFLTADWDGYSKTAIFKTGTESYSVIIKNNSCKVPYEVLVASEKSRSQLVGNNKIFVSVFGTKGTSRVPTNEIRIDLETSGYTEGKTPEAPKADVYAQILDGQALIETEQAEIREELTERANALKGNASGEIVRVNDVSPVEHKAKAKVHGKNLFKFSKDYNLTSNGMACNISKNSAELVLNGTATKEMSFMLSEETVKLSRGTYTVSLFGANIINGTHDRMYVRDVTNEKIIVNQVMTNSSKTFTVTENVDIHICLILENGSTYNNARLSVQIEAGDTATEYEPCLDPSSVTVTRYGVDETDNPETYTPDTNGTCEITSLAPTMTLITDTAGVTIDLEYNKDINAENEAVRADITELDNTVAEHTVLLGDVETALDNIIAMQNALIGGEA